MKRSGSEYERLLPFMTIIVPNTFLSIMGDRTYLRTSKGWCLPFCRNGVEANGYTRRILFVVRCLDETKFLCAGLFLFPVKCNAT